MAVEDLIVERVRFLEGSQLALQVAPPTKERFLFIYRTGIAVYWNAGTRSFEDRFEREISPPTSFQRTARALEVELGLRLIPSPKLMWEGVPAEAIMAIHNEWH